MIEKVNVVFLDIDGSQTSAIDAQLFKMNISYVLTSERSVRDLRTRLDGKTVGLLLIGVNDTASDLRQECLSLIAEVRERDNAIPIMVISTVPGEELAVDFIKAGATDFVLSNRLNRLGKVVPGALKDAEEKRHNQKVEDSLLEVLQKHHNDFGSYLNGESLHADVHVGLRVLILEDNKADALLLQGNLREQGFMPVYHVVDSKSDFVDVLKSFSPEVILSDFSLPGFDGVEALSIRNRICPDVPFIFVSGVMNSVFSSESLRAGATNYVAKDNLDQIGEVVRRAMLQVHERELRRAADLQSKRVQAMEQREDFMATLTHDLKNPLVGFDGIFQALLRGAAGDLNDEQRRLIDVCRDSNRELLSMIQHLLEVYRYEKDMETLQLQPVDLAGLVQSTVGVVTAAHGDKKFAVLSAIEDDLPSVMADPFSLTRAVQNLLDNAIKFGQAGEPLKVKLKRGGNSVTLEIENDGAGIPHEDQVHLFDRFWQGSTGRKRLAGTGLGLYLCKRIIDAHNGSIACVSAPGKGAKFVISLPVDPAYAS